MKDPKSYTKEENSIVEIIAKGRLPQMEVFLEPIKEVMGSAR
ncbi:hypothetical protein [Flammeovirga sp. SJP92]|nr:hypothetical protein [Flammeovirga sp. SJP92]